MSLIDFGDRVHLSHVLRPVYVEWRTTALVPAGTPAGGGGPDAARPPRVVGLADLLATDRTTAMSDLCMHELHRCTICIGTGPVDVRAPAARSRPFTASFASRCQACDFDVREGDNVLYLEDQLCHVRCANG